MHRAHVNYCTKLLARVFLLPKAFRNSGVLFATSFQQRHAFAAGDAMPAPPKNSRKRTHKGRVICTREDTFDAVDCLPSIHIEALFWELGCQHRPPGELAARKTLDCSLGLLCLFVLDVNLADACA